MITKLCTPKMVMQCCTSGVQYFLIIQQAKLNYSAHTTITICKDIDQIIFFQNLYHIFAVKWHARLVSYSSIAQAIEDWDGICGIF